MNLNQNAALVCHEMTVAAARLKINVSFRDDAAQIIDCGVLAPGGLEAGRLLATVCLADLGDVRFTPVAESLGQGLSVQVTTDHPVLACMAAQYAGWEVKEDGYFAIGSGPMRAAAGREPLFDSIPRGQAAEIAVGALETGKLPPPGICQKIAQACGVDISALTLLVAPVTSLAGTVQVVARSVETALHKLHELEFDLSRVQSAHGAAPLPPVSADDLTAIGRTNDAILYGGDVTLFVRGDDASLREIGPKIPSCASHDYGLPFAQLFEKHGGDFYQIDPMLFSPARVTLCNLDTGSALRFGHLTPRLIHESFGVS